MAEARTPEELSADGGGPAARRASECSVELGMRVYDASSVGPGASRHAFEQVVARANEVLTPDLACLTVREVRPWKQARATAPLAEQLTELRALDAGADVDLVVGLSPAAGCRICAARSRCS